MMLIGVDPHKSTHTATAVEPDRTRGSVKLTALSLFRW